MSAAAWRIYHSKQLRLTAEMLLVAVQADPGPVQIKSPAAWAMKWKIGKQSK